MKRRLKNYIAIVLDRSTSMAKVRQQLIQAFNDIKATLRKQSSLKNQDTYVTLITFSDTVDAPLFKHANVNLIPDLDNANYCPNGWTALFDATAKAIEIFDDIPSDDQTSFMVMVITDGDENKSVFTKALDLNRMMTNREDRGNWTFTFQLPMGRAALFCSRFGISFNNVSEWEASEAGTQTMSKDTQQGFGNYFDNRAKGEKQTRNFFQKVTPDLSGVNVKKQLDNLAGQFKLYTVTNESVIRSFVEEKTGKDYIPGTAFYQLVKPEKVQPSKEVLLQEKSVTRTKKIYGGPEARSLIGLPDGAHAKINPGNHDNYDIFIQSKSVNRILPRGSKILVTK